MEPSQNPTQDSLPLSKIIALASLVLLLTGGLFLFALGYTVQSVQEYLEGRRANDISNEQPSILPPNYVIDERAQDGCVITGCSSEICADEEMASICIYKDEFACYQEAQCARNIQGECGWVETVELVTCIETAQQQSEVLELTPDT
jgi:hypothetical protein